MNQNDTQQYTCEAGLSYQFCTSPFSSHNPNQFCSDYKSLLSLMVGLCIQNVIRNNRSTKFYILRTSTTSALHLEGIVVVCDNIFGFLPSTNIKVCSYKTYSNITLAGINFHQ